MPTFDIGITRHYFVKIEAETAEEAERLASNFLDTRDDSWESEREENHFRILEITMIDYDAFLIDQHG